MKRTVDVEMNVDCAKFETAINRFFKKHPELGYWKETFEYMFEAGVDYMSNREMADGTTNNNWTWVLRFTKDCGYDFTVVERA